MADAVKRAERYILEHYREEDLCLPRLCSYLGFSCSYFSTLFKKEKGQNYSHYITQVRLEEAARLLEQTSDTAAAISYQVGYSAPNYFSRAFKQKYGIPPAKYREIRHTSLTGL